MNRHILTGIVALLTISTTAGAIPHTPLQGLPSLATQECDTDWRLTELDNQGRFVQTQCTTPPVCPRGLEIVVANVGKEGNYVICAPCPNGKCDARGLMP